MGDLSLMGALSRRDASSLLDPMECTDTAEEQRVHSPPASLVPRIHVVLAQKLQHINPLLPACLNKDDSKPCKVARGQPPFQPLFPGGVHSLQQDEVLGYYFF